MEIENLQQYAPWLALPVVVLVVLGVFLALRNSDLDGKTKAGFKRDLVDTLRKQMGGVTARELSRLVGLDVHHTLKILESMHEDGLVVSHVTSARLTMWRLKGVGTLNAD